MIEEVKEIQATQSGNQLSDKFIEQLDDNGGLGGMMYAATQPLRMILEHLKNPCEKEFSDYERGHLRTLYTILDQCYNDINRMMDWYEDKHSTIKYFLKIEKIVRKLRPDLTGEQVRCFIINGCADDIPVPPLPQHEEEEIGH